MQLGISTYTFTWSIGVPGYPVPHNPLYIDDLLHIAKDNQVSLVQIADNMPLHLMEPVAIIQIRELAQQLGITIEVGTRGTEPGHLLAYLNIAKTLNATLLRTLITIADMEAAENQLREVLPKFEEAGIVIAVENHGLHTTNELTTLFNNLDSSYIGSCLDTVNSFSAWRLRTRSSLSFLIMW